MAARGKSAATKSEPRTRARSAARAASYPGPVAHKHVSEVIKVDCLGKRFSRADIVFEGVDHSQASFEARVFLNNPSADQSTPLTPARGYAGQFHIFGHGGCFGDVGHCDVRGMPRTYDPRPAHPLTPARKTVIATEAVRRAMRSGNAITVTVVPVVRSATEKCDLTNVLKFDRLSILTYL